MDEQNDIILEENNDVFVENSADSLDQEMPNTDNVKVDKKSIKEIKKESKQIKKGKSEFSRMIHKNDQPDEQVRKIKRIKTDPNQGLTVDQVVERINKGFINKTPNTNNKTYASIFIGNIFTFFNILCFLVAASLIIAGSYKDLMFMVVVLANMSIGIIQEIRAKRTIEKLSLLTAPSAKVVRGGTEYEVSTEEIVVDDIMILYNGKQIVADCVILEGSVEVNESLLTGESVSIKKTVGDVLYSGSFISSGSCKARVDKVGIDCYVEQLSQKAKQYKKPKSELFNSLNAIIKVIGFIIIPIAIGMYINNYFQYKNFASTISKTAGAVIGMIPSGMFLLSSIALTVSVIKLAQKKTLVQDLYCVEMLARVNILCLDKTGTITDGTMKVYNCIEVNNKSGMTLKRIIGSMLSALGDNNQTSQSLINFFGYNKELKASATLPFSSSRKLSAVTFEGLGTYILGAPEFVIPNFRETKDTKVKDLVEQYAKDGYRVLVLANCTGKINEENLPNSNRNVVAIIVLEDRIREDAIETIKWFKENDVKIKIISGDNPLTVAEIAKRVGVNDTESFINLEGLSETQVINAANKYTVFGRVTPEQKAILVKAMKAQGNTVAMTGDGVNDILALKEADCSIAMANGSEAVRSVSHMVLLDSKFSSMPQVVYEGRRVINNIQKSSSLFLMKTMFAIFISIFVICIGKPYPFSPIQFILLEIFVIGLPSFFLALQPNTNPIKGRFLSNVAKNTAPAGFCLVGSVVAMYIYQMFVPISTDLLVTMSSLAVVTTGFIALFAMCKPFNFFKSIMYIVCLGICITCVILFYDIFKYVSIPYTHRLFLIIVCFSSYLVYGVLNRLFDIVSRTASS